MITLLKKEFILELRRQSVIAGLTVYLLSTTFVCYITFTLKGSTLSPVVWSSLFWITVLFTSIHSIAKSFIGEKRGTDIYLYSLLDPHLIILSKIIYNFLLCVLLSIACMGLFMLFFGNPVEDVWLFVFVIVLAALGFSASLTMLSGIAARANNSGIVMPVLSFPIIISVLLLVIKITKNCIDGLDRSVSQQDLITLVAINCLVAALSYILFPYIWRS
ncbi:MAG TPA: heme exporter protein CcmB [Cyclobacteriaceae bacterium]|nr:heme exporter protein CcmB [Cyclobacteriaceae bacterium]